ncbi:MAG: peptidylprolyl isomerase [Ruminococcaceae bacterium]|nr:peptidylprolyl isomerase [Oscillospiraceae bacterium]
MKKIIKTVLSAALAVCMLGLAGCKNEQGGNISNTMTFSDGDKLVEIVIEDYGTIKAKLYPELAPNAVENFIKLAESGYYNGLKIHRVAKDMCIQGGSLNGDGTGGTALLGKATSFDIETSQDLRNFYGALGYANQNGQNTTQFYIVTAQTKTDITQYDPATIRAKAAEFTAKLEEGMESTDPAYDNTVYMEAYYTNLADMIEKASDEIVEKYNTVGGYPLWDGGYTIFGQVYDCFDVIERIAAADVTTDMNGEKSKPVNDIIISSVTVTDFVMPEESTGEVTAE